jgi:hypothetical protein
MKIELNMNKKFKICSKLLNSKIKKKLLNLNSHSLLKISKNILLIKLKKSMEKSTLILFQFKTLLEILMSKEYPLWEWPCRRCNKSTINENIFLYKKKYKNSNT